MTTVRLICSIRSLAFGAILVAASAFLASPARAANLTTLATFSGPNGRHPSASLLIDANGELYGTTYKGGPNDLGTLFKISLASGDLTTLASFYGANGSLPIAGLAADAVGNLYGTTESGGANAYGTVFKLNPGTGVLTTLATFNGANGRRPLAGLSADADGNLYGTTLGGGASGYGTVFKVDHATNALTTLTSFTGSNGHYPRSGVIADADGNLFGTTYEGVGAGGYGTVFKLDHDANYAPTFAWFDYINGSNPLAGLVADHDGNLFGTTSLGGTSGVGTVFQFVPATGAISTLGTFEGANGSFPRADLIADAAGNLFGTTELGGTNNLGTVFKLNPATGVLTTLASFNGANGSHPRAGLTIDAEGNLYGTTYDGGATGQGTVFKLTNTGFVVPEPASLLLLTLGVAAMVRRRRA